MPTATSGTPERIRQLIAGRWLDSSDHAEVRDPFRADVVALSPISTLEDCRMAVEAAFKAKAVMAAMPGHERAALLRRGADEVDRRASEIATAMTRESGKAIRDSRTEVSRAADLLRLCAEEAVRIQGEHVPMDASAMGAGKLAMTLRFPVGVVAAITPFNAPVNLAVHKVGPALAAGNAVVLKPSPKAPLSVHKFVEALVAAGLPEGAVNTIYGDLVGAALVEDPRVDFVSFTGSIPVGKIIRNSAGMKRVALELGGVGPTFVHHDADIEAAARACALNGVGLAGQSCVSVQNVYVHKSRYDAFVVAMAAAMDTVKFGDPMDPASDVGTLIDEAAAARVDAMVDRAIAEGAKPVRRASRQGALLGGCLLADVSQAMEITNEEIFGPAMSVQPYEAIEPLFEAISESRFGLQCGIFTNSLDLVLKAVRTVRTGGIIANATSRWRSDQMPYGGVKDSGMGREGPKFAIREMTEERLVMLG